MDYQEFRRFFWNVLDTQIPSKNRDRIKAYWKRFKVEPLVLLSDDEITHLESVRNRKIKYACVTGYPRSIFAFRMSFFHDAPASVLRTLVQHELIHVDHHSDDTPSKLFEDYAMQPSFRPKNPYDLVGQAEARIREAHRVMLDETVVAYTNDAWGGNQAEADIWIKEKEQRLSKSPS
jgi:hypothetical protein